MIIADPESLRWKAYQDELSHYWSDRKKIYDLQVVRWNDLIDTDGHLEELISTSIMEGTRLRIESPGRSFEMMKKMICAGCRAEGLDERPFNELVFEKGRIIAPRLFYSGLKSVLNRLEDELQRIPELNSSASPDDVAKMFDKNLTSKILQQNAVPVPSSWINTDRNYLEDFARLKTGESVYFKLAYGSSASGMVCIRNRNDELVGTSTMVELEPGKFFNTRKLSQLVGLDLLPHLNFIAGDDACVQSGIRKALIDGSSYDLRVVVLRGEVAFTIFRLSDSPFTNLHLGGRRGDWEYCRSQVPNRAWADAMSTCEEAATLFRSDVVGVDLVFERGYINHFVLELNPFGDFFPSWKNQNGQSVHGFEIEQTARAMGWLD